MDPVLLEVLSAKGFMRVTILLAMPFVESKRFSTALELELMALLNLDVSDRLAFRLLLKVIPILLR